MWLWVIVVGIIRTFTLYWTTLMRILYDRRSASTTAISRNRAMTTPLFSPFRTLVRRVSVRKLWPTLVCCRVKIVEDPSGKQGARGNAGQKSCESSFDSMDPVCARFLMKVALYSCFQHIWCTFARGSDRERLEGRVKKIVLQARYRSPRSYTGH